MDNGHCVTSLATSHSIGNSSRPRDLITVQEFWYNNGDCHQSLRFTVINTGLKNKDKAAFSSLPRALELEVLSLQLVAIYSGTTELQKIQLTWIPLYSHG